MISPSTLEEHLAPTMHPAVAAALYASAPHRSLLERLGLRRYRVAGGTPVDVAITIRVASESDGAALARLQQLDGHVLPAGPRLLAEAGGQIVAAAELRSGSTVSDPFAPSAGVVSLLQLRARQVGAPKAA
jgi:hypothetical protein